MENECIGCGCTENNACMSSNENCHWLRIDKELSLGVCSSCPDQVKAFEQHQKEVATLAQSE